MDAIMARGRILWNSIYDPYEEKLHDKLSSYHPDFMCEYLPATAFFILFRFIFCWLILETPPFSTPHSRDGAPVLC